MAVPLLLGLNLIPVGKRPRSDSVGSGYPAVRNTKVCRDPVLNVACRAETKDGACLTVRLNACFADPALFA
jgi:hypothetical protein